MMLTMSPCLSHTSQIARPCRPQRAVACKAVQEQGNHVSRRSMGASIGMLAGLAALSSSPAQALGLPVFGDNKDPNEEYKENTGSVIKTVQDSLAVAADDPKHDQAIEKIRSVTKDWVAQYRKGGNYTGRPSYGNTYTALNALAGHYNNFGPTAPVPKKRLDRVVKELADAQKLLERNR